MSEIYSLCYCFIFIHMNVLGFMHISVFFINKIHLLRNNVWFFQKVITCSTLHCAIVVGFTKMKLAEFPKIYHVQNLLRNSVWFFQNKSGGISKM